MCKIAITVLLGAGLLFSQTKPSLEKPSVESFSFMTGHWRCEIWGGSAEEIWSAPSAGSMLGMFRFSRNGKLAFTEFLTLEDQPQGAVLYMRHFHLQLKAWEEKDRPLVWTARLRESAEAWFEREGGRMSYRLESPDVLVATLTSDPNGKGDRDGKKEEHVFRFRRVKPQ